VTFTLDAGGFWLISFVRMNPVNDGDSDWESFWASVTFDLGPGDDGTPAGKK